MSEHPMQAGSRVHSLKIFFVRVLWGGGGGGGGGLGGHLCGKSFFHDIYTVHESACAKSIEHFLFSLVAVPKTCAMMNNISQYINFALSNITHKPADCSSSQDCSMLQCRVGYAHSALEFSLDPCALPPSLHSTVTNANGTVVYDNILLTSSQELAWDISTTVLHLNVTVQHYNASTVALKVSGMMWYVALYLGP